MIFQYWVIYFKICSWNQRLWFSAFYKVALVLQNGLWPPARWLRLLPLLHSGGGEAETNKQRLFNLNTSYSNLVGCEYQNCMATEIRTVCSAGRQSESLRTVPKQAPLNLASMSTLVMGFNAQIVVSRILSNSHDWTFLEQRWKSPIQCLKELMWN